MFFTATYLQWESDHCMLPLLCRRRNKISYYIYVKYSTKKCFLKALFESDITSITSLSFTKVRQLLNIFHLHKYTSSPAFLIFEQKLFKSFRIFQNISINLNNFRPSLVQHYNLDSASNKYQTRINMVNNKIMLQKYHKQVHLYV